MDASMKRLKFTTRSIGGVQVSKRTDFTDPDHKGLTLRVTPSGTKTWALLYRRRSDGKKRRVTIAEFPDKGLADARTDAMKLRAAIALGEDPAAARSAYRKLETMDELLDRYLKDYAEPRKRSAFEDRRIFKKDIRPFVGQHKIGTVTRADVLAMANRVKDRGSGFAANRVISSLRRAFNWAKGEGYISGENPAAGIEPRAKPRSRDRSLSADEIRGFWLGLDKATMTPGVKLALKLALVTGQRIGEVCGAEMPEINLARTEWIIPGARTKNRREHAVPLSKMALQLFRDAMSIAGEGKYVFPSSPRAGLRTVKKALASHGVAHAMAHNLKALGLEKNPASPHDLRRSIASHLAALGFGENIVARILNHSSVTERTVTGSVYIRHSFAAEKRQALEAWAAELDRIIRKRKQGSNVVRLRRAAHA
jgi:integrase